MQQATRNAQAVLAVVGVGLLLAGCSSPLTLEQLEEAEMSRSDFDMNTAVVADFEGLGDDIPFLIADEGCNNADVVMAQAGKGKSGFATEFEERNDDQNYFSVSQELITFETEEDATDLLNEMEDLVSSGNCEFSYDLTQDDVSVDVRSAFTNVERNTSVLTERADDSFSWDTETTEYWSGDLLYDFSNRREGSVHLFRFGSAVMVVAIDSTEQLGGFAELETDITFRSDLESGVAKALSRLEQ